jgi:hypothetical protein
MGTWSHEQFGNDDANDWAYDQEGSSDLSIVEQALDDALEAEDYLEAPEGANAVAAVEVLAKLLGKGTQSDAYTEKIDEWIKTVNEQPSTALLEKAKRVLERVSAEDSELHDLWSEVGNKEWATSIDALKAAIS